VSTIRHKIVEHLLAIAMVGLVVGCALVIIAESSSRSGAVTGIGEFLLIDSVDYSSPLHRALFRDAYRDIEGVSMRAADSVLNAVVQKRLEQFTDPGQKVGGAPRRLTWETAADLLPMYASFVAVYAVVLLGTFFAARVLAIYRFALMKTGRASYLRRYIAGIEEKGAAAALTRIDLPVKALLRGIATLILFSPAYVIAYALRTRLDTENLLFMSVLGLISNGILINYANKFYALLVSESRKGYVETAIVKGLASSYRLGAHDGMPWDALVRPHRRLKGHVFRHIYLNAHHQFVPSLKEHAAFLITGLVIIEMALNIRGHLCYALLQHILYREIDLALTIVFGIFVVVKLTELGVDISHGLQMQRYNNAE